MNAEIGMYRNGATIGSSSRLMTSNEPIRTPSGNATDAASKNAKVMRRVIRAAYLGEDAGDLSALENLSAVEEIRETGAH